MGLAAEYILKQSKIQLGVDSSLNIKSQVDSALAPGMTLQFSAEINNIRNVYRFGYGIMMG